MKITYSFSAWKVLHARDKQAWPQGVKLTEYLLHSTELVSVFNHELQKEQHAKSTILSEIIEEI